MARQFLLNYDGSVPNNIDINKLQQLGIMLVQPVHRPSNTITGYKWVEGTPILQQNGTYLQTWESVLNNAPVVTETPEFRIATALSKLTLLEKRFLLRVLQEMINDSN